MGGDILTSGSHEINISSKLLKTQNCNSFAAPYITSKVGEILQANPSLDLVGVKQILIVFDTTAVNSNSNNIKTTLYHTVLNYCEDYFYRRKDERVILVVDKAHIVIDRRLPETVARLATIEKSCRKFESAIWICSQQLIDFLDEVIKKSTQKQALEASKRQKIKGLKEQINWCA